MNSGRFREEIAGIRAFLAEHPDGVSITDLSEMLSINRNSLAKYLDMLRMQGSVSIKKVGSSRIFFLCSRLPATAVLRLSSSSLLLVSQGMTVVDSNDLFLSAFGMAREEIVQKPVNDLPFTLHSQPSFPTLMREGLSGREGRCRAVLTHGRDHVPCTVMVYPVFFEDGSPGVSVCIDRTDRRETGKKEENEYFRALFEADESEYFCRFEPDMTLAYASQAYCEHLGTEKKDLVGKKWRPVIPEPEYQKLMRYVSAITPDRPVFTHTVQVITSSGEARWQQWKMRGLFDHHGSVTMYLGTGRDITTEKRLEEQLHEREQELSGLSARHAQEVRELNRLLYEEISFREKGDFDLLFARSALDHASFLVMGINRDGRITYLNRTAREVLGDTDRELVAKNIFSLLTSGLRLSWKEVWEVIERDRSLTVESTLTTHKGQEVPVVIGFHFLEVGESPFCCCFVTDDTERRHAEEDHLEKWETYRDLADSVSHVVFALDHDLECTFWNRALENLTGVPAEKALGMSCYDLFPTLRGSQTERVFLRILQSKKPMTCEARHLLNDRMHVLEIAGYPTKNGLSVFIRDITEKKDAEETAQESIGRLTTVLDSLDALVYVVDMETYEILFVNRFGRDTWGVVEGRTCWQSIQTGQTGPCPFCTNHLILDSEGRPNGTYRWEFLNTATGRWYDCRDSAIRWTDGRLVRLEIAVDITGRDRKRVVQVPGETS